MQFLKTGGQKYVDFFSHCIESDTFVAIHFKSNFSEYKQDEHVILTIRNAVIF